MGREIIRLCTSFNFIPVAGIDVKNTVPQDFPIYSSYALCRETADLLIDFSHAAHLPQTLQFAADQGAAAYLVGLRQIATVVKNGAVSFPSAAAGTVSVFCMGEPARGVSIRGLKYELDQGTLTPGFPLGVSNSFVGKPSQIEVKAGSLLVIYDRGNGLPEVTP